MEVTIESLKRMVDDLTKLYVALAMGYCRDIRASGLEADRGVVWKTRRIPDEEGLMEELFVLGIGLKHGERKTIFFLLPMAKYDKCWWAREIEVAPVRINPDKPIDVEEVVKLIEEA